MSKKAIRYMISRSATRQIEDAPFPSRKLDSRYGNKSVRKRKTTAIVCEIMSYTESPIYLRP